MNLIIEITRRNGHSSRLGSCVTAAFLPQMGHSFRVGHGIWTKYVRKQLSRHLIQGFFKENVRYPVWTRKDPISLILGTR